jgi:endonuclease-3
LSGRLALRDSKANAEATHDILADLFPPDSYYAVHLNLIRHGREVCHARNPACERCVLQDLCAYYQNLDKDSD